MNNNQSQILYLVVAIFPLQERSQRKRVDIILQGTSMSKLGSFCSPTPPNERLCSWILFFGGVPYSL
jgi:hypothetical protein